MVISWIAALKLVPWPDVVSNAPMIVNGAKTLWKAVGKKTVPEIKDSAAIKNEFSPHALSIAVVNLKSRVSSLEVNVADLQREMVSSAELIKSLADQNSQLIQAVEFLRVRMRLLLSVVSIIGIAAIACLFLLLVR